MKTITGTDSVFDGFVSKGLGCVPDAIARNVEAIDLAIYSAIGHARLRLVKKKARTIMTTAGPVTYARRCYEDSFRERYVWPADAVIGVPARAKVSNELKRRLVKNAAAMTYSMDGNLPWLGKPYEKRAKWAIDTPQMRNGTRKIIDGIRHGVRMFTRKNAAGRSATYLKETLSAGKMPSELRHQAALNQTH